MGYDDEENETKSVRGQKGEEKGEEEEEEKRLVSIVSKERVHERKWNDQLTENDRCLYFRFDSNNHCFANEEKKLGKSETVSKR